MKSNYPNLKYIEIKLQYTQINLGGISKSDFENTVYWNQTWSDEYIQLKFSCKSILKQGFPNKTLGWKRVA